MCVRVRWLGWDIFFLSYFDNKHLQGEEAKNIPGESMTEEHYMDHDGNLISRKVKYSFVTFLTPEKHSSYEEKAAYFY